MLYWRWEFVHKLVAFLFFLSFFFFSANILWDVCIEKKKNFVQFLVLVVPLISSLSYKFTNMDEVVFYIAQGDPADKHSQESYGYVTSIHSSKQYASYRQADSHINGTAITGIGPGERIFTAVPNKALINVYSWGKESVDQRIPIPEALTCITLINHPNGSNSDNDDNQLYKLPNYRVPWLLAGGSKSGKLYIWELSSGNLLCVRDAHYQGITTIKGSSCGTFLITGGEDARCLVWNLAELISIYDKSDHQVKPYWQITDNTLPLTDLCLNDTHNINDLKLYTTSEDSTVRIYDIVTKSLLTTFILPSSAECITKDPANRALYVGLNNGLVRSIPLYSINSHTSVLESIGGMNKIITVDADPNLKETFVAHQQKTKTGDDKPVVVTKLTISFDGTSIISGDSEGRVFVSDIVTKQVVKSFTPCNSPIAYIAVETVPDDFVNNLATSTTTNKADKKHRMIPQFKRVLASTNSEEHQIFLDIPGKTTATTNATGNIDFATWLQGKQSEELQFKNLSGINSIVKQVGNENVSDLEEKLQRVSQAYTELRNKHEELIKEHAKLLDKLE